MIETAEPEHTVHVPFLGPSFGRACTHRKVDRFPRNAGGTRQLLIEVSHRRTPSSRRGMLWRTRPAQISEMTDVLVSTNGYVPVLMRLALAEYMNFIGHNLLRVESNGRIIDP